jgi:hypothetical protein
MTTAASLASYASNFPSFRNRIINGNLSNPINQRGAGSITESTGYTYDRWYYDGSTYLYQGIEDKNVNNGTYVISWVGDNLIAHWALEDDNDTTPPYTAGPDSALTWNLVSKNSTFTINESSEYGKHLWIRFSLDTGGDFATLDKVQVEEGTVATPFEHRPISVELSLAQRYYQHEVPTFGTSRSTDNVIHSTAYFKVTMRDTPTSVEVFNQYGQTISVQIINKDYYVTFASSGGSSALHARFNISAEI